MTKTRRALLLFHSLLMAALVSAGPAAAAPPPALSHDLGGEVLGAQIEAQTVAPLCAISGPQSDRVQTTVLAYNRPRLENASGNPDFNAVNRDIDRELGCGIQPMLRLGVAGGQDPGAYPPDPGAYAALLTALAAAEKGRVHRYAIENEVSAPGHWSDSAENYFRLVGLARDAIHAGDPSAVVLDSTFASGALSVVKAREIYDAGDGAGALALLREVFANELGGGSAPPTTVEEARVYLFGERAQRFYTFFDALLAHQDLFDVFQLHYYGPSQSLPDIFEMLRRRGMRKPIETWELNHRYLDGRPFVEEDFANEVSRLFATAVGEGSRTTVLSRYIDYAPNAAQGLTRVDGGSHASRFAFRTLVDLLSGATASGALELPGGATGYAYGRPGGRLAGFWALSGTPRVGSALGFAATSAAVRGNESARPRHLRISSLRASESPQFAEADLAILQRLPAIATGRKRAMRIRLTCPPASPFGRCAGVLKVVGKRRGEKVGLATHAFGVLRGRSHTYSLRLHGAGKATTLVAAAKPCPGGLKPCRSWLALR